MSLEQATIRKVTLRIMPVLIVCYFAAYLDRVNVGFAALQMNKDIGLSAAAYGFGAGLFFLTYFVFEVPANLAMHRFGARRWIARIMISWGLVAGATAFVTGPTSFYAVRLLLGAAEAGFQPGVLLFLTLWFPPAYRGRMVAYFMAAVPICGTIGSPISGMLLSVHGLGLAGWQWLYLLEALPSVLLGLFVLLWLTDRPEHARWLAPEQRGWLVNRLAAEQQSVETKRFSTLLQVFTSPILLCIALVYFSDVAMNNANSFFLPQIVKAFGLGNTQTGFVTAIPNFVGLLAIVWWGRHSDRHRERVWHAAGALMVGGAGLVVAALIPDPLIRIVALSVAVAGTYSFTAPFWASVTNRLSGIAAAGGIAAIGAIGNLGGLTAPSIMGFMKGWTGSFAAGQIIIAAMAFLGAIMLVLVSRDPAGAAARRGGSLAAAPVRSP
jgi:MFS family permease